jgi:hypothetical protein
VRAARHGGKERAANETMATTTDADSIANVSRGADLVEEVPN